MSENRELFSPTHHPPFVGTEIIDLDSIVSELYSAYVEPGLDQEDEVDIDEGEEAAQEHTREERRKEGEIETLTLSRDAFVKKLVQIGQGSTFAAVTGALADDSVGFLEYNEKECSLYITTPNRRMFEVGVDYIDKVRYANSQGNLEVVINNDSRVSRVTVTSYSDEKFNALLSTLQGKVVHAKLRNGESVFGVFRKSKDRELPGHRKRLRAQRRPIRESEKEECMYEIQEMMRESQTFPAETIACIEVNSTANKVMRYERIGAPGNKT
jgi:hypothetical protein